MINYTLEIIVILIFLALLLYSIRIRRVLLVLFLFLNSFILEYLAYKMYAQVSYSQSFISIAGIPLWIIFGWVILLYPLINVLESIKGINLFKKALLLAFFMVLLDLFFEPLAYFLNLWTWESAGIYYLNNFFAWGLFSFLIGLFSFGAKKNIWWMVKNIFCLHLIGIPIGYIWFITPRYISIIIFAVLALSVIIISLSAIIKSKNELIDYYKKMNRACANNFSKFSSSRRGMGFLAFWSFFESSFWFIAPDMPLQLMTLYAPKKYKKHFLLVILPALLGATFYFILNTIAFDQMKAILSVTPFITSGMENFINSTYFSYGYLGLLFQGISLMSLKLWVHLAVQHNFSFLPFIFLTGVSRSIRFFCVAFLGNFLGLNIKKLLREHAVVIIIGYAAAFLGLLIMVEAAI